MKALHIQVLFQACGNPCKQKRLSCYVAHMYLMVKYPHVSSSSSQLYKTQPGPMIKKGDLTPDSSLTAVESDNCK